MRKFIMITALAAMLAGCADVRPATCIRDSDNAEFKGTAMMDVDDTVYSYEMIDGNNQKFSLSSTGAYSCTIDAVEGEAVVESTLPVPENN